jgi:hypothetical protein
MPDYRVKKGGMHDRFLGSRKKIQVIGGGFGNGKTAAAVIKGIMLAKSYPGCNGIIAMATFKQLNDTIREEFYKWVPHNSVARWPTAADNTLIMKNGSKINFRYIQQKGKTSSADGTTFSNLLSATYDWAIIDQVEDPRITHKDFLDINGRLRGSTPYKGTDHTMPATGPRWLILTANPSFNWFYHQIIKPYQTWKETGVVTEGLLVDKDNEPIIEVFEAATYENAHNLEPDFISTLESVYKGQFRKRYLEGEWGAFEGLVYPTFDKKRHLISREDIIQHLLRERALGRYYEAIEGYDHGLAEPACYLLGFADSFGRFFILDGFYQAELSLGEIANNIIRLRNRYFGVLKFNQHSSYADPAIFRRNVLNNEGKTADTIADIFYDNYNIILSPGQNSILSGISKVSNYFAVDNYYKLNNDPEDLTGGMIYINAELSFIADELGSYFWKTSPSTGQRIDEPIDAHDHSLDTIKYMMSELPNAAEMLYRRDVLPLGASYGSRRY